MARRKSTPPPPDTKARLELRFDPDVYARLRKLADDAHISVNQLMNGLARWAVTTAHLGEPVYGEDGEVSTRWQAGCIWFGDEERAEEDDSGEVQVSAAHVALFLDFTERHVVRDDWRNRKEAR